MLHGNIRMKYLSYIYIQITKLRPLTASMPGAVYWLGYNILNDKLVIQITRTFILLNTATRVIKAVLNYLGY